MMYIGLVALAALINGRYALPWIFSRVEGSLLLVSAITGYASTLIAARRHLTSRFSKHILVFTSLVLIQACWILFSLLWTPAREYGLLKTQAFLIISIGSTVVLTLSWKWISRSEVGTRLLSFLLLFGAIYGVAVLAAGESATGSGRTVAFGFNAIRGSQYVVTAILILLGRYVTTRDAMRRLLLAALVLILLPSVLLLGSRGPILAAVIPAGLIVRWLEWRDLSREQYFHKRVGRFLVIGTMLLGVLLAVVRGLRMPLIERFSLQYLSSDANVLGRYDFWTEALEHFVSSNMLVGTGIGAFGALYTGTDARMYPHNIVLEFLSETGLIGIALFCAQMWMVIRTGWKWRVGGIGRLATAQEKYCFTIFFALFLFTLLNAMTTGDLIQNSIIWFYGILTLIYSASIGVRRTSATHEASVSKA